MNSKARYTASAIDAAAVVLRRYSSSFYLASRLLPARARPQIASIYALVRIADEIVDGACDDRRAEHLAELERATTDALATGFSSNPVVHAFADTARSTGFGAELTGPFFASMRADLTPQTHTAQSLRAYIHGSAEVIGLMCLKVFLYRARQNSTKFDDLAPRAAALGSAFQKINFLRDIRDDEQRLQRGYLPDLTPETFAAAVAEAENELAEGRSAIALLPRDVRAGVRAAADVYAALLQQISASGLVGVRTGRVRVGAARKLFAISSGMLRTNSAGSG